jgi:uncharacterized lipoprotein
MRPAVAFIALALMACTVQPPIPPSPEAVGVPLVVHAPFAATWDAVIDAFAARNTPITTIERESGFIATGQMAVGSDGQKWADCGTALGMPIPVEQATYNVRVKATDDSSTVKATVRWTEGGSSRYDSLIECSTKGVWERSFEEAVKERAEGR